MKPYDKESVFNDLNQRGFIQYASIESESVTEYRFSDGTEVIKIYLDNFSGFCHTWIN